MDQRCSVRWVAVAVGTLAGALALALAVGDWQRSSLDERARALVAEGRYLPAIRLLSAVVARAPGDAGAHYYLGLAYAGIGLCGAASLHLEESARLAPAYRRLGARVGAACQAADSTPSKQLVRSRGHE